MNAHFAVIIQREQHAVAKRQGLIDQSLRRFNRMPRLLFQNAGHDFDVVLAKTIQSKWFAGGKDFSVGANFRVAVFRRPLRHVGMKPFAVLHHRSEQQ